MTRSDSITTEIEVFLEEQEKKELLRFITCGSVDDGKSTLIGRLLWDSELIYDDQIAALQSDSSKVGRNEVEIDFALLLDGLQAEREQGITIDVALFFFDRYSQIHCSRYTGTRAVHSEYGDGCLNCQCGGNTR